MSREREPGGLMLADQEQSATTATGADQYKLRVSAAIRVALAVVLAGVATAIAVAAVQGPLDVRTDVIGYPIFADFNPYSYYWSYALIIGFFPLAAVFIFLGLTRIGRRVRLPVPASRGRLRPLMPCVEGPATVDEVRLPIAKRQTIAGARIAFVGAVLGLEVGIATGHLWLSVALTTLGYCLLIGIGSAVSGRVEMVSWGERLAAANAVCASICVAGLALVSANTEVRIASNGAVHHYPWFPLGLALPLCVVLAAWTLASLRRTNARAATIERRAVFLVVVPVALFLLVAHLYGDIGQINLFEEGQALAETRLVDNGWLPWRDVVITHGLLYDVFSTQLGFAVLGNSYWGLISGWTLLAVPITVVAIYFSFLHFVGRNWAVLLAGTLIFIGTWLETADPRLVLWPVILLLMLAALRRPKRLPAAALGLAVVAQAILTPEAAGAVIAVTLPLIAFEWYWRPPDSSLAESFRRTAWYAAGGIGLFAVFAIYMASRGALGDVVYVTRNLISAHFLVALPPGLAVENGVSQGRLAFVALAPLAGVLISFAYAAARLALRRPFLLADWPMAAVVLFVIIYYSEFLARMDLGHAFLVFQVALPLLLYIVYRVVSWLDRLIHLRFSRWRGGWMTAHPIGVGVFVTMLVLFWGPMRGAVEAAPASYRPATSAPPVFARAGYASGFDTASFADLRRILNAYLGPHGRLEDLTNESALFYYFMQRDPSTRWYVPDGIIDTPELQQDVIRELRRSPPKLIVFDDTDATMPGLPEEDGVPAMVRMYLVSRWILDHYRPLLVSHGRSIYARRDLPPVSSLHLHLRQAPQTTDVPFLGQACSWGYSPTFLQGPAEPPAGAAALPARVRATGQALLTLTGWAGDPRERTPAREVIATLNGRVVGRAVPHLYRPDVPAAGYPSGFVSSGFQLTIPAAAARSRNLRVLAVAQNHSIAALAVLRVPARAGTLRFAHQTVHLNPSAAVGHVDSEAPAPLAVRVEPPTGSTWADYRWLQIDAPSSGFVMGGFQLSDLPDTAELGHVISFQTLKDSPHRYVIPVSSCTQWHGFGTRPLFLTSSPVQHIAGVRLIR